MKIAWVVHDFDPGLGQGRYSVELASRLAERHDVHVYANTFSARLERNITFQRVPAARRAALSTILSFSGQAEKLLRRQRYDIVHAQGLVCRRADVVTAHICNAARRARMEGLRWMERVFFAVVCPLERRFYQRCGARWVAAISRQVAGEIRSHYGWSKNAAVIYHGTDSRRFRPPEAGEKAELRRRHGLGADEWIWLFAGEAVKGLEQAIRQLPAFPEARLTAVSRSDLAPYRSLSASLGVESRVRLDGPTAALHEYYRLSDVFVYASEYDAFGLVVAEAMSSGLPVIVGKNTGAAEWIRPGENGFVCDPSDAASITEPLRRIQGDPAGARDLGAEARRTVLGHSWDECAARLERVYEAAAEEKRSA